MIRGEEDDDVRERMRGECACVKSRKKVKEREEKRYSQRCTLHAMNVMGNEEILTKRCA